MSVRTIAGNAGPTFSTSASSTSYFRHIGLANSPTNFEPTEANISHTMGRPGKFANLTATVLANTRSSATQIGLRKNGADTALALNIPGSTTGVFSDHDPANAVSVAAGDTVALAYATGSGTGDIVIAGGALLTFEDYYDRPVSIMGILGSTNFQAALLPVDLSSNTKYVQSQIGFGNQLNLDTTAQQTLPFLNGTIRNFQVRVSSNTRTGDVTFTLMKNTVATSCEVTITAGNTGVFQDTAGEVTFSAGDLFNIRITGASSTGQADIVCASYEIEWDSDTGSVVFGGNTIPGYDAWNADTYVRPLGGAGKDRPVGEVGVAWPFACTLTGLQILSDVTNGDITDTININGTDGNLTITSISSGSGGMGGVITDTTHSDVIAQDDVVALHYVRAGTTTNGWGNIKWLIDDTAASETEAFCWFDVTGGGTLWEPLRTGADEIVTDGAGNVILIGNIT